MITVKNLRYRCLSIDNLEIPAGITSVIGINGSGKTTLLKMLAGITKPDSGTILIDGIPPRDTEIGWVNEFPDRNIMFWTPFEEIAAPLRFRHQDCTVIHDQVGSCIRSLGLGHLEHRPMSRLSGGEKVLVALASALVFHPRVLVLDEYDSHLDSRTAVEVSRLIRLSGTPYVIQCTQDMDTAAAGDSVLFLSQGRIACHGKPEEVFPALTGSPFYPLSWRCGT